MRPIDCNRCGKTFERKNPPQRFCSSECRLYSKVKKGERPDDCWKWIGGSVDRKGYPRFVHEGRPWLAHRFVYSVLFGKNLPKHLLLCHSCDNPGCVNPLHLWPGTNTDNIRDCIAKGRFSHATASYGEDHGSAKITWSQVRDLRKEYDAGAPISALARKYGLSYSAMYQACKRMTWKPQHDPTSKTK